MGLWLVLEAAIFYLSERAVEESDCVSYNHGRCYKYHFLSLIGRLLI